MEARIGPVAFSEEGYDFQAMIGPHTCHYGAKAVLMEARTVINGRGFVFSWLKKHEEPNEESFLEFVNEPESKSRGVLAQAIRSQLRWDAREGIGD